MLIQLRGTGHGSRWSKCSITIILLHHVLFCCCLLLLLHVISCYADDTHLIICFSSNINSSSLTFLFKLLQKLFVQTDTNITAIFSSSTVAGRLGLSCLGYHRNIENNQGTKTWELFRCLQLRKKHANKYCIFKSQTQWKSDVMW